MTPVAPKTPDPGLDRNALAALLHTRSTNTDPIVTRIAAHLQRARGYVAWSGGRDSTAVVALARQADPDVPVVFFDSGLELPDTLPYLTSLAEKWGLNFHRIAAVPTALDVLKQTGLWDHSAMYNPDVPDLHRVLITGPSDRAHTQFGPGEITGMRVEESVGRRALLAPQAGEYTRKDGSVCLAPLWAWNQADVQTLLTRFGIPEHPAYARFQALGAPLRAQRVGLAVDGNNPDWGRYTWLRLAYPDLWAELVEALPRLGEWR